MALTPNGETGKLIQLKRTGLDYNNQAVINEQLNYGEPLYNDKDKTLLIGDSAGTANDELRVAKFLNRLKANTQVYYANADSSTLDATSSIAYLYNESNSNVYIKNKSWGELVIDPATVATYNYAIDSDNTIIPGSTMSTAWEALPCLVIIPINGMRSTYVPTISSYLPSNKSSSVSDIKAQTKAFACIGRMDSANNALYAIFYKKPAVRLQLNVVGG